MVEEVLAEFNLVIVGLIRDYMAVMKLSIFFFKNKSQVLLGFLIFKKVGLMSNWAF
jgi:hypothetical protein